MYIILTLTPTYAPGTIIHGLNCSAKSDTHHQLWDSRAGSAQLKTLMSYFIN